MVETLTYQDFLSLLPHEWIQSQHLTIGGPTGSGKSSLASDVLTVRTYVVAISNKKSDETLEKRFKGNSKFTLSNRFPPMSYRVHRVLFWIKPDADKMENDYPRQRDLIRGVVSHCFKVGGWSVYFDDLFAISDTLGMKKFIQWMYTNLRSNMNTIIACLQRPAWVPVEAVNQVDHFLMLRFHDERDIERIASCFGLSPKELASLNAQLRPAKKGKHGGDFLWLRHNEQPILVLYKE